MKQLLIVEDSWLLRESLTEIIDIIAPDWVVHTACDGHDGYNKAIEIEPDLILTDFEMPIMDGLSLVSCVRRTPRVNTAFVAMMSGTRCERTIVELKQQCDLFIRKPLHLEQLRTLLNRAMTYQPPLHYSQNLTPLHTHGKQIQAGLYY